MNTRIVDLVGRNIDGWLADIRTRNEDGSFKYGHDRETNDKPASVRMKRVYFKTEKASPTMQKTYGKDRITWLYWTWDGFSCGYSGIVAEDENHLGYYLDLFEPQPFS